MKKKSVLEQFRKPISLDEALDKIKKRRKKPIKGKKGKVLDKYESEELTRMLNEDRIRIEAEDMPKTRAYMEASRVAELYAMAYARYYNRRIKSWSKRIHTNKGVLGCCSKASATASSMGVSLEDFIDAQFWFYHKIKGRPPFYKEIAGPANIKICNEYIKYKKKEKGNVSNVVSISVETIDPTTYSQDEIMQYEEKILKKMIKKWKGEEIIWEMWGSLEDETMFSNDFKKTREVWIKMYQNGN